MEHQERLGFKEKCEKFRELNEYTLDDYKKELVAWKDQASINASKYCQVADQLLDLERMNRTLFQRVKDADSALSAQTRVSEKLQSQIRTIWDDCATSQKRNEELHEATKLQMQVQDNYLKKINLFRGVIDALLLVCKDVAGGAGKDWLQAQLRLGEAIDSAEDAITLKCAE